MSNILVFAAHPDDEVVGAGGTIKKYSEQGENVVVIIFSCGEKSDPLQRENVLMRTRINEARRVGKLLGVKETIFLAVPDGKVGRKLKDKTFLNNLKRLVRKYKPNKVFTHSSDDFHGDHMNVHKIVIGVLNDMKYKGDLFTFGVWSPLKIFKRDRAKLYVDISKYFDLKLKALKLIKSQQAYIYPLLPSVHLKARVDGAAIKAEYAEKFNKVM
jgi:LmbE family N-acetylglucosaminyl deacetylase